jgi:hypothetical protein
MHFEYQGFTHDGNRRCFLFRGSENRNPVSIFSVEVELSLFVKNGVPVQEGPMFCLQLLTTASLSGSDCLDRFHSYHVVGEDFRPLLIERERRAAEKALRKAPRQPLRKRPFASNLHLGTPNNGF